MTHLIPNFSHTLNGYTFFAILCFWLEPAWFGQWLGK